MKKFAKDYWIEISIAIIVVLFIVASPKIHAEPTCSVTVNKGMYNLLIKSDVKRVPDANDSIAIPARTPIAMDSYFNSCIIYPDHTPVQGTEVVLYGEGNDWNVTGKTEVTGCFNMTIPSDVNFSIKAINPDGGKWSYYRAFITSAKKGTLLDDPKDHVFPFDNDLINVAKMIPEPGFKKTHETYNSFTGKANLKENKHSMTLAFPTKVNTKYVVSFKSNRPVWVWFSDDSRKGHNPAKLTGGSPKLITLDPLTAKKSKTTLWFQPQTDHTTTITELSIKAEVVKPKPQAKANTCVPFGDKMKIGDSKSGTYWRKCRRPGGHDWQNG